MRHQGISIFLMNDEQTVGVDVTLKDIFGGLMVDGIGWFIVSNKSTPRVYGG